MHSCTGRPRGTPVLPALQPRRHLLEVGEQDAVRDEARRPVGDCRCDSWILHTLDNAFKILSGVKGIRVTRALKGMSASLMAFITAAGAPAVPASPTPLAPSCDCLVGVSM